MGGDQELSSTKNEASGAIDLNEAMVKELSEHLERNGLVGADPTTLIFSTANRHRPLHYSNWRNRVWVRRWPIRHPSPCPKRPNGH